MKKLISVTAFTVKAALILTLVSFGASHYDAALPFYKQHVAVWALLYLPIFAGYESLIDIIFNHKGKGK